MTPTILPLGDNALLVRFGSTLSDEANGAAIGFARRLRAEMPLGVSEIDPNLVSVLLRYDPEQIDFDRLAGEVRLLLSVGPDAVATKNGRHVVPVAFGGEPGPDLDEVAATLGMTVKAFIKAHNAKPLRLLTTGFAPGFVYCGFHPETLRLPRRTAVRSRVAAGAILFAAGQTAITATPIPTGWHVIGRTDFRNFDPQAKPPTRLHEGDEVVFEAIT